jgi:hypothetical protein
VNESDLKEDPIPEKNVVINPYYQGSPYVKLVMSSRKRKNINAHTDTQMPPKKRIKARKSTVFESPADSEEIATPADKIYEGLLEAKLNCMRRKGFTSEEFIHVVMQFGITAVLNLVGGKILLISNS